MKKLKFTFSDLTKKQLKSLKEQYIKEKVNSLTTKELKEFVQEIIRHQITDTIDKEEEMEAWKEISDFYGEDFEIIICDIKQKYADDQDIVDSKLDSQKQRIELLERNNIEDKKKDMWDD